MQFTHDPELVVEFPQLTVATLTVDRVTGDADAAQAVAGTVAPFYDRAAARLAERPESEFPEIAAWRRAFSQMALKPTQYRCAAEALLRRFRKEGTLPSIHPLVDVCNAISMAYAIPVAVFDLARVTGDLTVRHAVGTESYLSFGGDTESPALGEVIFADTTGHAHARRWTHRQSALSAIRSDTGKVLIVSEAMHETGQDDVAALRSDLNQTLGTQWTVTTA